MLTLSPEDYTRRLQADNFLSRTAFPVGQSALAPTPQDESGFPRAIYRPVSARPGRQEIYLRNVRMKRATDRVVLRAKSRGEQGVSLVDESFQSRGRKQFVRTDDDRDRARSQPDLR